ncbi:MAG: glycosyltransferase family 4 protein [Actinomycetota bacterium]|nr:glycosyltransferase family 4 protein [Actinomycetota bacterium]
MNDRTSVRGGDVDRRRRVVLCVQNLSVPQDRRVWREARSLAEAGYDVSVICPGYDGSARREHLDGVDIVRYPRPPDLPGLAGQLLETVAALFWTSILLLVLRRRGPIDVVHAANPPDTFVLVASPLRRFGTRFVYDQHDLCPELLAMRSATGLKSRMLGSLFRVLEQRSYRTADLVVAPNNSYRRIALDRGGMPPERVVVVRSGPDEIRADLGHDRSRAGAGPLVVSFAGVMGRQDRLDVLLEAAAEVLSRRPDALRLDLIGRGDDIPRLRKRAAELGIAHAVSWPGWLFGEELASRLAAGSIAVSLDDDSLFNRLSTMTKVPEYLALGLPALIADLPENRVSAGNAAVYFAPGDPTDLAKRLESLLDDGDQLAELRRAALERASHLLWAHSASRLVAAYEWLLAGGKPVEGDQVLPA